MHGNQLVILCAIIVVGFLCQWAAWRLRLPSILFLLLTGIVAGPVLGLLEPNAIFGDLLVPLVSVAVAVILFEGSLTLRVADLRGHGSVVRNLVTLGTGITWICGTLAASLVLGWDLYLAALFGAIVTVSGPTVVTPLLRAIGLREPLSSVLRWEGILIDPLGAILALLVFDFILATQSSAGAGDVAWTMVSIALMGIGLGVSCGYAFGLLLRRHLVPDFLRNYAALATMLAVFGAAEWVEQESGLLAVTIMGIWLANMRGVQLDDVLNFKESLTVILVGALFIVLSARLDLASLVSIGGGMIAVLLILQLVAGPLRAALCSIGSPLEWRQVAFLGWMFPRGIVAAAISALFALRLEESLFPNAEDLVPLVFGVILGTVIIQSVTARPLARWLGLADPDPTGVLVVGSNRVALTLAEALHKAGRRVLVASDQWDGTREARMRGLQTFYGSPVSAYAENAMDLTGIGYLVAASRRPDVNALACVRFARELGRDRVFTLANRTESQHEKYRVTGQLVGRLLFDGQTTLDDLHAQLDAGSVVRSTEITKSFGWKDFRREHPNAVVLFGNDADGQLIFSLNPGDGRVENAAIVKATFLTDRSSLKSRARSRTGGEAAQAPG